MAANKTGRAALRRSPWSTPHCDLESFRSFPKELAFAVLAGLLTRNRDELAADLRSCEEPPATLEALVAHVPDLGPAAEALRRRKLEGPPRRATLDALHRRLGLAEIFLSSFAPPASVEDPVVAGRIHDIARTVTFLVELLQDWRQPAAAACRRTG